jgi:hypothetical protein
LLSLLLLIQNNQLTVVAIAIVTTLALTGVIMPLQLQQANAAPSNSGRISANLYGGTVSCSDGRTFSNAHLGFDADRLGNKIVSSSQSRWAMTYSTNEGTMLLSNGDITGGTVKGLKTFTLTGSGQETGKDHPASPGCGSEQFTPVTVKITGTCGTNQEVTYESSIGTVGKFRGDVLCR